MKSSARLDSAIFQLTPTRTRCDLLITAHGKTEKIASGLLNPFIAHLKIARDQIAKGGYSILLEPEDGTDAPWFTKGTVERFVRFVSTPEILERVYTIEAEILQIEKAIVFQGNTDVWINTVENHEVKPAGNTEGSKSMLDANEEKAIVIYKPGEHPREEIGPTKQEENSKVQLLKVLETRKIALQKEQGMAFARAVAAGFDVDNMAPLLSFSERFGAERMMDACLRFIDLWKAKLESGQLPEIEAAEAMSSKSEFSTMNASGIMLASVANKHNESHPELGLGNNVKAGIDTNGVENQPTNHQAPTGPHEYYQGQFPHPMFSPWPIHSPPGTVPVFPAYTMQGVPFYQPVSGPFYQPPFPSVEENQTGVHHRTKHKRHSSGSRDSNTGSETSDRDVSETKSRHDSGKAGKSGKKKPGVVVIRNINYISSKKQNSSGSESESTSGSESIMEAREIHRHSPRSSKRKGSHAKSVDELNTKDKEADTGHWQAFQSCLLRDDYEDQQASSQGMFGLEKDIQMKRQHNSVGYDDPSALDHRRDPANTPDTKTAEFHTVSGNVTRVPRASNDDFMIGGRQNQLDFVTANGFERTTNDLDRSSSRDMADESFVVPFRSMSLNQVGNVVDMDSELSSIRLPEDSSSKIRSQGNYEPYDLSLMPEREAVDISTAYDPALDYEMQVHVENAHKGEKEVTSEVKQGSKKSDKDQKSKVNPDDRRKSVGPIRKGKPSKVSPLDDARARAEKLRNYKADLQKMKKEKEKEDMKRLEALKMERQKRIAAKGSSTSAQSPLPSLQTRKPMPTKLSPSTHKGSKFSDSVPGLSSSPLQRSNIKSTESRKAPKATNPSNDINLAGNRLTRSVSSLSDSKKEISRVTPDSKASMARIRRLSEPKSINSHHVTLVKTPIAAQVSKSKAKSSGPESKKISAILNLDKSKAATLPELKIKTPKRSLDVNNNNESALEQMAHQSDVDDNIVVEKNVVMLECDKPSIPVVHALEEKTGIRKGYNGNYDLGPKSEVVTQYDIIHVPVDALDGEPVQSRLQEQSTYTIKVNDSVEKESCTTIAEKPYQAPHARISSLEDASVGYSDYSESLPRSLDTVTAAVATVGAHVSGDPKLEKNPENLEKPQSKDSSKGGFRRLLKFGKKNHSSVAGDRNVESDNNTSVNCSEAADNNATIAAESTEVYTLKNLIYQDDPPSASTSQKSSRHFSLLSPFRGKK